MSKALILYLGLICTLFTKTTRAQTLNSEAEAEYSKTVDSLLVQVGTSYFSFVSSKYPSNKLDGWTHELSQVSTKLTASKLTLIDSLNLFEWKGIIEIGCKAVRVLNPSAIKWSEWRSGGIITIALVKKRNSWRKFIIERADLLTSSPPPVEILQKYLKYPMSDEIRY